MPDSCCRKFAFALLLACATLTGSAFASQPDVPALPVSAIADGVYVHHGAHADLDDPGRGDSANIGFVVGEKCVAVIDTGGSLATGRGLRAAITATTTVPVCYVINTHVHFDHVLGNAAFVADDVEFIGHENLAQAMVANRDFFAEEFAAELDGGRADLVIAPSATVAAERLLDLGGRTLEIEAHPAAHSSTDLTVLDRATNTLWTGDLVFMERMPIIDGTLKGWLAWIKEASAQPYDRIVPGHGPIAAAWPDAVAAENDYLQTLLVDGRAAIAAGVFLEDAMASMSREAAAKWLLNGRHPRNVSRAYRELEWE
jgi:quinoprotein relay system zinc metallohydrolase 2